MIKKIFGSLLFIGALVAVYTYSLEPRLDRDWSPDQTLPAQAEISDDEITLRNVRNFTYRSTTDYTPAYYDTMVKLSELETVEYIIEPFGDIGAAHTFLSFGFSNGQQIAISIEIRKEKGESFSPWKGVLNQYEIMYVIADERDVVNLRTNYRQHDVYIYPTIATKEQVQQLFLSMLNRANKLQVEPEFYNTVFSNCTTNIATHINEITPNRIGVDYRLLLPEYSDVLAQELGLIAQGMTIEEARAKYRVNEQAKLFQGADDFSKRLRESVPTTTLETYEVSKVLDGDTIEVIIAGENKRVRYIGIDTPEVYPDEEKECLADEAATFNASLVKGQKVSLVKDVREVDDYGRLLRYVYVGDTFVNEKLLATGYAKAVVYSSDTLYKDLFKEQEIIAKTKKLGIWGTVCEK